MLFKFNLNNYEMLKIFRSVIDIIYILFLDGSISNSGGTLINRKFAD
jgi:hypothetical protein